MSPYLKTVELRIKFCKWYRNRYDVPFELMTTEAQDVVIQQFLRGVYFQASTTAQIKDVYL